MDSPAAIPELLIPSTPAPPGAGSASIGAPAVRAPDKPATEAPSEAGKDSEFSNTFKALQDDSATQESPDTGPAPASAPTEVAPAEPTANAVDSRLSLASTALEPTAADAAIELGLPVPGGNALPPGGEALPVASNAPAKTAELIDTVRVASPGKNMARGQATPTLATLSAAAAAATTNPLPTVEGLTATTENAANVAANATGLPANLLLAKGRPGEASIDAPRTLPEVVTEGLKAPVDNTGPTLRNLLLQATPAENPRIALPQFADASIAASMTQLPTNPTAAFTDTLAELMPSTGQQTLQPTGDRGMFAQGLGQRLVMMADNGLQSARIKLYPEHLGPLDIRVQVDDDMAKVWFHAQHGQTRDALEQALPRLRDMFAEQGLELVRSEVADGGERFQDGTNQAGDADSSDSYADNGEQAVELATPLLPPGLALRSDRLLDVMA